MRVAVTAAGASLDAQVDPRFGRCPCFLVIDTESMDFEAIENPNVALGGGAGLQSGQLMAEKDVQIVLTGNCGPNAHQVLSAAGIQVIIGCSGMVCEVVERFKAGGFRTAGGPNVTSHFGVGGASSSPQNVSPPQQGAVSGAGMGMGRGRGMGRGGGRGMGISRGNPGAVLDGAPPSCCAEAEQGRGTGDAKTTGRCHLARAARNQRTDQATGRGNARLMTAASGPRQAAYLVRSGYGKRTSPRQFL